MLKPVDMQVIVPKMTELARMHGSESERQLLAAQQGADSTRAMVAADTREVHAKKDVQRVTMREKREPDSGDSRGGKKRRGGRGSRGGDGRTPSGHIDIKL